ncbi:MAG: tetratricopeptide repeat protein, partial [Vicinamibacterales bacterium]
VLLTALLALLVGLALGKAWERYKLREGRWVDRRRLRESPHFIQGLNCLVAGQVDQAIVEFTEAVRTDPTSEEVNIILGNLHREKGQVGRAIHIHQQLLGRPALSPTQHAYVLLCLGLDFKRGGFVDRALEAFTEVLKLDPTNAHALANLEKLHEDQQQWQEAYAVRQRLAEVAPPEEQPKHRSILAFLETELGKRALGGANYSEALKRLSAAIDLDAGTVPAYLALGDLHAAQGRDRDAIAAWEQLVSTMPDAAYLGFERLAAAYTRTGQPERFPALCRRLIAENAQHWRAGLALGQYLLENGAHRESLETLFDALAINPHALTLHHTIWRTLLQLRFDESLVLRYIDTSRAAVFYRDPHICIKCHYRSNELLWQCPHCHEWSTFIEERLAAAADPEDDLR